MIAPWKSGKSKLSKQDMFDNYIDGTEFPISIYVEDILKQWF